MVKGICCMNDDPRAHQQAHGRVKIRFALSPEDSEEGVDAENLWAEGLGRGRFVVDSIPLYVYGVSNRDTVAASVIDDRLCFDEVVDRGGHSTYRVLVKDDAGYTGAEFKSLWEQLKGLTCSCEVARRRWVAIDVPANADADAVSGFLNLASVTVSGHSRKRIVGIPSEVSGRTVGYASRPRLCTRFGFLPGRRVTRPELRQIANCVLS